MTDQSLRERWNQKPSGCNYLQVGEMWTYKPWVPAWMRQAYCRLPVWRIDPFRPLRWVLKRALLYKATEFEGTCPKFTIIDSDSDGPWETGEPPIVTNTITFGGLDDTEDKP